MSVSELFDLSGKVAIITGGHSGIGKGIAEGLAEAGANLVIAARRFEVCQEVCAEISQKQGVKCLPVRSDVTRTEDVIELVKAAIKEFGKIDILVNSAGVGGCEKPVLEMSDKEWDSTLNVNLKGIFLCSREATREMIKQKSGKIINVASIFSFYVARNMADYAASKGGVLQLTRVMALELTKYNIQVNVLCPGYFLTPLNYEFFSSEAGKRVVERSIPVRRLGDVKELKGIAIYLASPASSFTTGASFVIDGGQSIA